VNSSNLFWLVTLALFAGVLAWLATFVLRRWSPRLGLVDIPNERSSHVQPTPRGGGLSFVIVALVLTVMAALQWHIALPSGTPALLLGSLLIAAVGLADDRWHLLARSRFSAHLVGAVILMVGGGVVREVSLPGGMVWSLGWLSLPLTLFWVVGLTNAYNFMDGIDGLASGQAVIATATMAWLGQVRGVSGVALAMAVLTGAVLGFLLHNWPPARIFMGDVGSAFLGFTFAGWAVLSGGARSNGLSFVAWVAVLAPFLFDTGLTLISRIVRGQRWYAAHREHFYQRLIRQGWSHLAVTSLYLIIAAFLGLVTVAYYGYGNIAPFIFVGLIVLPLIGIIVLVRWVETRSVRRTVRIV
jgi:Fuc2NAc and GlcNAc transferase